MHIGSQYSPDAVLDFAQRALRVKDAARMQEILAIYHDWYHNRTRVSLYINDNPGPGEVDKCLVIRVDGTEEEPENIYISHSKKTEWIVWRQQKIRKGGGLAELTPLEVGAKTFDKNFGGEYLRSGHYLQEENLYQANVFKRIAKIRGPAGLRSGYDLCDKISAISGHEDWPDSQFLPLLRHARAVETEAIRKGVRDFLGRLDPDALKILAKARLPETAFYSWLVGYNSFEEPASPQSSYRNRQSAAFAYPSLIPSFFNYGRGIEITRNLDAGMPVPQAILSVVDADEDAGGDKAPVSLETLKWLHGKKYYFFDEHKSHCDAGGFDVLRDIRWLDALPREWRPRNAGEYAAYRNLYCDTEEYAGPTGRAPLALMREFVAALNNPRALPRFPVAGAEGKTELKPIFDLVSPVQEMVLRHARRAGSAFELSYNVKDAIDGIKNQIILPEACRQLMNKGLEISSQAEDFSRQLVPHVFGGSGILKILSFSRRWHIHADRLRQRTSRIEDDLKWEPLVKPLQAGGVNISAMTSTKQIREMGRLENMNNCIGGYTYQCTAGRSHLILMEAADGSWKTNLELYEKDDDRSPRVYAGQHSARGNNTDIPEAAKAAELSLVDGINSGRIEVDWAAIRARRASHRVDSLILKIGFDPASTEACDEAYLAWHRTMRDLLPDASRDDFMVRSGLRQALAGMVSRIEPGNGWLRFGAG